MRIEEIKEALGTLGIVPKKSRGQNFLLGESRASAIVAFAGLQKGDTVLEIGPGLGALTRFLVDKSDRLYLVEKEFGFAEYLKKKFTDQISELKIFNEDVRDLDLKQLDSNEIVVVSNVPYSISSEIILWTVEQRQFIARASYLLQKEFSERIAAAPGSKAYGSLSVLTEVFFERILGDVIEGNEFFPTAEVSSRLVKLTRRTQPLVEITDQPFFEKVVRSCFAMRRKTITNNVIHANFYANRVEAEEALKRLEIDPRARAETIDVYQFARLVESLHSGRSDS